MWWAISLKLPVSRFWMDSCTYFTKESIINYGKNGCAGYILEADTTILSNWEYHRVNNYFPL